jgi:hypothetical protein
MNERRTHSSATSRSVCVARIASIDLENEVSPAVVTGDGRANGTATTPCGDDGGTFGGKKASLMRIDD